MSRKRFPEWRYELEEIYQQVLHDLPGVIFILGWLAYIAAVIYGIYMAIKWI